jgi:hypothetical protein
MPLLSFPKGKWNWVQDVKLVYWNAKQASPYNNLKGKFLSVGSRYAAGQFPSMPGGPDMPTVPERV